MMLDNMICMLKLTLVLALSMSIKNGFSLEDFSFSC